MGGIPLAALKAKLSPKILNRIITPEMLRRELIVPKEMDLFQVSDDQPPGATYASTNTISSKELKERTDGPKINPDLVKEPLTPLTDII